MRSEVRNYAREEFERNRGVADLDKIKYLIAPAAAFMQAIQPGRPPPKLHALGTALWNGTRIVAYISGRALVVLSGPRELLQTIYIDQTDATLQVLAVNEATGQIAVGASATVYVYSPASLDAATRKGTGRQVTPKWRLSHCFTDADGAEVRTLCWVLAHELLVSSATHLKLWQFSDSTSTGTSTGDAHSARAPRVAFQSVIANPLKLAEASPDGQFIATAAEHDCLLKIWRRRTYDAEQLTFDVSYLRHGGPVADVHWKKPCFPAHSHAASNPLKGNGNVLCTSASDNLLRVFTDSDLSGKGRSRGRDCPFAPPVSIDMAHAIQPRDRPHDHTNQGSLKRYALMLDCREFATAVAACEKRAEALQSTPGDEPDRGALAGSTCEAQPSSTRQRHALEHILEIAERNPDICIIFDDAGHMSVWGVVVSHPSHSQARTPLAHPTSSASSFASSSLASAEPSIEIFNISHVEGVDIALAPLVARLASPEEDYARFSAFAWNPTQSTACWAADYEDGATMIAILAHHFDGRIEWLASQADVLFDPAPCPPSLRRLVSLASWSGHQGTLKKIVRDISGRNIVSRTDDNKATIWHQDGARVVRQSTLYSDAHIHRTCLLDREHLLVNLHHECVILWDVSSIHARQLGKCVFDLANRPSCILQLPNPGHRPQSDRLYIAAVAADMSGIAWQINLANCCEAEPSGPCLTEFCHFQVEAEDGEDFAYMLPVDPAGSSISVTDFFDLFSADIALSYTSSGTLKTWTARVNEDAQQVQWLRTAVVPTGIAHPSVASGTSIRKAAVADQNRNRLTIWDTRSAQLEFEEVFESRHTIRDIDWTSTPDNQSVLAIGFPQKIVLMSQLRYDYLDHSNPAWGHVHEIYTHDLTPHPIGDSCWLGNGGLVVGSGNQLFMYGRRLIPADQPIVSRLRLSAATQGHRKRRSSSKPSWHSRADLFHVVGRLNGPLPVFHPQFLSQCILSGKLRLVHLILVTLSRRLKFFSEGDELDTVLGIPLEVIYEYADVPQQFTWGETQTAWPTLRDEGVVAVDASVTASLRDALARVTLPGLTSGEQFRLLDIAECVATVEKHRQSMDGNAARFILFFREYMLRKGQGVESSVTIPWREIVWAFHSESQEILTELVTTAFQGKMTWEHARECGLFAWLRDLTAIRTQLEIVARNEYTAGGDRDPVKCSLYYFALRKKNVVQGLWRVAHGNKEQKATQWLLSQDFSQPRWRAALLKNAYALLGRHRFHYAAAFFLLADCPSDAAHVCIRRLNDLPLAIAITRAYEGDSGPVLRNILERHVLPQAAVEGNRWMATWAFWLLRRRDLAVRSLVSPVDSLVATVGEDRGSAGPGDIPLHAKSYLSNDPALSVIYQQLREKTLQTLKGFKKIPAKEEWDFVLRNARLYGRMGCDLLALNLVRQWRFIAPPPLPQKLASDYPSEPAHDLRSDPDRQAQEAAELRAHAGRRPHLLMRRSSLTVADISPSPSEPASSEADNHDESTGQAKSKHKSRAPTVFVEPDANALLDSFGI
ncbi:regulator of (H+)-ATPase in vacuolar membrane [Ascosphaera acerosa]|nr:regulator of (H+)-ATPase in vacuolar membrane [Ascosphaera acerosa]